MRFELNCNGGGMDIYCRNKMQCSKRNDIPTSDTEVLCIEILPPQAMPYVMSSWYRSPSNIVETFTKSEHILQLQESGKKIILLRDTNCDFNIFNGTRKSMNTNIPNNIKHLMDLYDSVRLRQLIEKSTKETIHTSTLIGNIAINIKRNISESSVLNFGLSDHYLVYAIRDFRGNILNDHEYLKTRD